MMDDRGVVTDILAFNDLGPVEQVERLARTIKDKRIRNVCVEMNSIGAIYYDMLKKALGMEMRRFNTTNETKRNVIEQLITAFQTRGIGIPYDEELIAELQHYTMERTSKGYTYNGADGVHDDYVIALALAYDTHIKKYGAKFSFNLA